MEILIPADDPVRLLRAFVERMELSDLYQTYGKIKKNQATPRIFSYIGVFVLYKPTVILATVKDIFYIDRIILDLIKDKIPLLNEHLVIFCSV